MQRPSFQLRMAMQLGEKTAGEFGFTDFPIDPRKIKAVKDISIYTKDSAGGISGALIIANSKFSILHSTEFNNEGFENFCLSHELGHYFLPDHPEIIMRQGGTHYSRAGFTENTSIELEADHFASGLLMPSDLTRKLLSRTTIGLDGILSLADRARASRTAAAIRAAECSTYPIAVIVSREVKVSYAFLSDGFKKLGKLAFLRKGTPLPPSLTKDFNANPDNVLRAKRQCASTTLHDWFDGPRGVELDEEIVGLGAYGFTLTVLSNDNLPVDPDETEDEEADLKERWKPRFAYGR
ncbi:MAG: ImmA/IrrE family metallo-endopeptidase [Alphaproteobacteria bacterium]|nr:ImmA/IrrE family metallo-endopeptidase [Alphaproteobacteria bacterium]